MADTPFPPTNVLGVFGLSSPRFVTRTGIASIWETRRSDGAQVALKLYHNGDFRNEAPGLDVLRAWDGGRAVRILASSPAQGAIAMEWLPGPSLGDLSRAGRDREATEHLATIAQSLHGRHLTAPVNLPRLSDWFSDLLTLSPPRHLQDSKRRDLAFAAHLARHLLTTEAPGQALHGDLHQDNVRKGARGYTAFDAKGLWAEPCYELANAFRNPNGFASEDVSVVEYRARCWSDRLRLNQARLLGWAAAKAGLSIAWQLRKTPELDPSEWANLEALCAVVRRRNETF